MRDSHSECVRLDRYEDSESIGIPRTIPRYGDRLSGVFGGGICLTPLGVMITPKI